jgi:hypothetical protein
MPSRKEIIELVQDLPIDDTWLFTFMERLKAKYPELHNEVVKQALARLEEES